MANKGKNKIRTVVSVLLALAAIGFVAYKIYQKFFQKKSVAALDDADEGDLPVLDGAENDIESDVSDGAEDTVEVSAESVIANAEAMEA